MIQNSTKPSAPRCRKGLAGGLKQPSKKASILLSAYSNRKRGVKIIDTVRDSTYAASGRLMMS